MIKQNCQSRTYAGVKASQAIGRSRVGLCDMRGDKEHMSQSCKVSGPLMQGRGVRGALAETA